MKRKLVVFTLMGSMLLGISACGNKEKVEDSSVAESVVESTVEESLTEETPTPEESTEEGVEESVEEIDSGMYGASALLDTDYTKFVSIGEGVQTNVLAEFIGWHLDAEQPYVDVVYMIENYSNEPHAFSGTVEFDALDSGAVPIQSYQIQPMELGYFVVHKDFIEEEVALLNENQTLFLNVTEQSTEADMGIYAGDYMEAVWEEVETEDTFDIKIVSHAGVDIKNAAVYVLYLTGDDDSCVGVNPLTVSEDGILASNSEVNIVLQKADVPEGTNKIAVVTYGFITAEDAENLASVPSAGVDEIEVSDEELPMNEEGMEAEE